MRCRRMLSCPLTAELRTCPGGWCPDVARRVGKVVTRVPVRLELAIVSVRKPAEVGHAAPFGSMFPPDTRQRGGRLPPGVALLVVKVAWRTAPPPGEGRA